jgi:superfamily II helicase
VRTSCGTRTLVAKTCRHCGELKLAKHFSKNTCGTYYNSQCHDCNNAQSKPALKQAHSRALGVAVRHRQPWTEKDINKLHEMAADRIPVREIALALNRSVYAVYTMKTKLKEKAS